MCDALIVAARKYRAYSEALYAALAVDPFYIALEEAAADPARSKDAMLRYYDYSIYEAERFGILCQAEGAPIGVSVWSVPISDETARQKHHDKLRVMDLAMGPRCVEVYETINRNMAAGTSDVVSASDWYLSILGILPAYQGQGRGGDLLRPVLERADQAGVATYLETFTPRNMSFYQRLGYEAVGIFQEAVTQCPYWVMRRKPG